MHDADDSPPTRAGGADAPESGDEVDTTAVKPEMQGRLGDKLKEVYADVLSEPVPDRFLDLLAQLDAKSSPKGGDDD